MSKVNKLMQSGGCCAPGEVLATSKEKGNRSGTGLLGNLVETPILRDYIAETNGIPFGLFGVATGHDWWDTGKEADYINILLKRHKHLKKSMFPPQTFQWPDILTYNGVTTFIGIPSMNSGRKQRVPLVKGRNEFYEIKPDSDTGITAGENKIKSIIENYRPKHWDLPYRPGDTYPSLIEKKVSLPVNNQFVYLALLFILNHNIARVRLYLSIRRHKPGLLVYKICIEIETSDKRRQKALAMAAAKHLYAAYVVTHSPEKFKSIAQELGDYSFEGEKIPRIKCTFDVIEQLVPMKDSIEQALYMRGIALPKETWMLYCDEAYYQRLVAAPPSVRVRDIWDKLKLKAATWIEYASGSVGWAKVKPYILEAEAVVSHFAELFPGSEEFVDQILSWIHDHPYESVAIVTVGMILTASVVGLIESGLIASTLAAADIAIIESAAPHLVSGAGRIAMTEGVATEAYGTAIANGAASKGFQTAIEVSRQIGRLGQAANASQSLARTLSPSVIAALKKATIGVAASVVLGANISTAHAASKSPGSSIEGTDETPPIGFTISTLRAVRKRLGPGDALRAPYKGELVDANAFADRKIDFTKPFEQPPKILMRYLGSINIS